MKINWMKLAPAGLVLSTLAALGAAGYYIVVRKWDLPLQILLGLILVGLALYALLNPEGTRQALTGRQARFGSNALVITLAFLGIVIVANYLVYKNDKRWDLTQDKENTLSKESLDTLAKLPEPVVAEAYYTGRVSSQTAETLLKLYAADSKGRFTYKVINPEADPVAAQKRNVTRDGDIVLVMGDKQEIAPSATEEGITTSLVRLMSTGKRVAYFLTGHGERDPEGSGQTSYSQLKTKLEGKNYTVKELNLLTTTSVPEDASVVVVAGPEQPITQNELTALTTYLDKGGSLIVMEEPIILTKFGESPDLLADYLAQKWGITLGKDIVVDQVGQQQLGEPLVAVGAQYGSHPITQGLQNSATIFFTARSVQVGDPVSGITSVKVVLTTQQSYAETDLAALQGGNPSAQFDQNTDLAGPIALVVAAENASSQSRLVVFGDSDIASDAYINAYGDSDLMVNAMDWTVKQENLITLTPKPSTQRTLSLPTSPYSMGLTILGSIFILPGLVLVAGIAVYISRRRRG